MEYPPRDKPPEWWVTVFDRNHKPLYVRKGLTRDEAVAYADKEIERTAVGSCEGHEVTQVIGDSPRRHV